ncbi:MAG TPA: response regulator transcription factor [Polyangiales bacterium]
MNSPVPTRAQPIRILLVDDHPIVCSGLAALIAQEPDLEVVGRADDGLEAQELVASLRPEVVLMDLLLPRLGGVEATQRIKADFPDVKVLALTALDDTVSLQAVLRVGASGVMLKRSAPEELVRAIRCVAHGDRYVDTNLSTQLGGVEAAGEDRRHPRLSERESQVLKLLAAGHTARDIAARLCISARTLETYRARALQKLALKNRADIVSYAAAQGWLLRG